jgi:hypothetical protein
MDPLIEVSTGQGGNMRETCARVLAAALMTGAIATVVGMSALFDTPSEVDRALVVPPSSLQRTVRVKVPPAPRHAPPAERLVSAHTSSNAASRPVLVTHTLVRRTVVVRHVSQRRQLAAVRPKPAPAPQPPPPAAPAAQTAAPPPPSPVTPDDVQPKGHEGDDQRDDHGDGHGEGNGNGKAHGHGHDERED